MMYAHPYEQLRNGPLQAQFVQQPLSFDYCRNARCSSLCQSSSLYTFFFVEPRNCCNGILGL
ncbi:hypothetical protein AtNW77_Chr00c003g0323861 [Arabidopsis thaliana]